MANTCYLDFKCVEQHMERTDTRLVASNAAGVIVCRFDLCPKWDGLDVFARFDHMGAVYDVPLVGNTAVVPWEVCKAQGFTVALFGEGADGARLTSVRVPVDVERSIDWEGAPPIPASPSLIQHFEHEVEDVIAIAADATAVAQGVRDEADAGDFDGATFLPFVSSAGVISWENDKGKVNPNPVSIKGTKGDKGDTGATGATGAAATITVDSTTTLASGSNATVENTGTSSAAKLKFGIPMGAKGEKGDKGDPGDPAAISVESPLTYSSGVVGLGTVPLAKGGTGATTAAAARTSLGAAATSHKHSASQITSGTLAVARGGTGATAAAAARTNLDITPANIGAVPKIAGIVLPYAGAGAPDGFLTCDGSAVSRTTYALLFTAIGTAYGSGDGSTTFNLPDMQGRVPVGTGDRDGTTFARGGTGGETGHTLTIAERGTSACGGEAQGYGLVSSLSFVNRVALSNNATPHNNMQPYTVMPYIISTGL